MRAGIRLALETDEFRVCALAASIHELVTAVQRHKPQVCLLDTDVEGDALQAIGELAARAPTVPVILLAGDDGDDRFLEALRAGATGYVDRRVTPRALPNVVRAVLNGEAAIPRSLARLLVEEYRGGAKRYVALSGGRGVDLTIREWDVLTLLREGLSTRDIAARLVISDITVRRHIGAVVKKLDVDTRAEVLEMLRSA